MRRIRVINKTRAFISTTVFLLLILTASFFIIDNITTKITEANSPVAYTQYAVEQGDSLWTIAKSFSPSNMDVRNFIYQIEEANNLTNSIIQPGQELFIPILDQEVNHFVAQSNN